MIPSKSSSRLAWIAGILLAAVVPLGYAVGTGSGTTPPLAIAMLAAVAAAIAAISAVHASLLRMAAEEARDIASRPDDPTALFRQEEVADRQVKGRNLRQFERWFLPVLTGLLALGEAVLGIVAYRLAGAERQIVGNQLVLAAVLLFVAGVVLYLFGSYLAGLAFSEEAPELRATAGETVGLAYLCGLGGAAEVVMMSDFTAIGQWVTRFMAILLMLRAIEKVANIFLEIYRPRQRRSAGYPHESRISGLVAQPRSMLANLADTLNYQFGLQLTEARMRRLGWQILPFLALQGFILLAFSCLLIVNPGEEALIERLGRPLAGEPLGPGLHGKLPWPIDRVFRVDVETTRSLTFGTPVPLDEEVGTVLWANSQATPTELLVVANRREPGRAVENGNEPPATRESTSFNLLGVSVVVRYRVADVRQFVYAAVDAREILMRLCREQVAGYLAGHDLLSSLEQGLSEEGAEAVRMQVNQQLTEAIAGAASRIGLGVEIVTVGLIYVQPPPPVAEAFQTIIAAGEERTRMILEARTNALQTSTSAQSEALRITNEALGYAVLRTALSDADQQSFLDRLAIYRRYPEIYEAREYFFALKSALAGRNKIIVATKTGRKVMTLDLKKQAGSQLFDIQP